MPFFKDLKRRSRASFHQDSSSNGSSNDSAGSNLSNSTVPTTKSSSTLNSSVDVPQAPPLKPSLQRSLSNLTRSKTRASNTSTPTIPERPPPQPISAQGKRYSMLGSTSGSMAQSPKVPLSFYAPQILSISENSWVHQKVFLIFGQAGPDEQPLDGTLTIHHHQDSFPPVSWPVCASKFKALVHLNPGPNELRLEFSSPKLVAGNASSISLHSTTFRINYLPLIDSPPLQLVILLGKDSPGTFDTTPEKGEKEGNDLAAAVRKYRMAAHLWQAFTAEQMYRHQFGRRCFRLEEEWQPATLSKNDGRMRNEVKVHIIRSKKTVAEIRDLDVAQQYEKAQRKGELWSWAMEDVREYFRPQPGQTHHVAVLLMDSQWDKKTGVIRGHTALGGGDGTIQIAVFGSHALHSYPSCIEDVVPALSDCTKTNTDFVAKDCGEDSGTSWQAACVGIGAHLHEVGHLLGCPHQTKGVMLRDYVMLNRTFLTKEPYSTRTKQQGIQPCMPEHEIMWHRLDALRFRSHPCFRLVTDPPICSDEGIAVWPIDQGRFMITAKSGISFIELYPEGKELCENWIEYTNREEGPPRQITISESELKARLPPELRQKKLKIKISSRSRTEHEIEDVSKAAVKVKMPRGQIAFKGPQYGFSRTEGSKPQEILLDWALDQTKLLRTIRVYHAMAIDGIEFIYEDSTTQLFGKTGGQPSDFGLDTRRGETLTGFNLRSGLWIDGIQILTSLGRRSEFYGNPSGGSGHTLMPPRGYSIAGISGSCGPYLDGFALIITR